MGTLILFAIVPLLIAQTSAPTPQQPRKLPDAFRAPSFKPAAPVAARLTAIEQEIRSLVRDLNDYANLEDDTREEAITSLESRLGLETTTRISEQQAEDFYLLSEVFGQVETLKLDGGQIPLRTRTGLPVWARVRSAKPYIDGYEITIDVGNPTSAIFRGIDIELKYEPPFNPPYPKTSMAAKNPETKSKERVFSFHADGDYPPGHWTPVVVTVTKTSEKELRNLTIRLDCRNLGLFER